MKKVGRQNASYHRLLALNVECVDIVSKLETFLLLVGDLTKLRPPVYTKHCIS